ncbi:HU family DNA-binding protein [Bacteroides clarus]|uniref:HU family DNA-binding protein n=1 Tax=Bacteroides clarus TaxID=626929 RepID=UPI0018A89D3D|nr:HU family DNA-binding protein [Bacteroides clarus]
MSAYYDLFEKPDIGRTGEQQPLYARFVPKGTIDKKEFIDRVHLFTGISRSVLEGTMAAFMDELRDCLANGWTVELGELGYFTPSLSCQRRAMEKDKVRAASVALRGLNFRLGKRFYEELGGKMKLERKPRLVVSTSSDTFLSMERRFQLLDEYLQRNPCINRAQYARLTGRSYKQAINDLNLFIENGVLFRYGMGRNVVYAGKK